MQTTQPSTSQLALLNSLPTAVVVTASAESDSVIQQKAWHILSILISLGRPAPAAELASRCTLFYATPDLIRSLCYIPNSPITLSDNDEVIASLLGYFAFKRFASNFYALDSFPASIRMGVCGIGISLEDTVRMYFQKRKRIGFDLGNVEEKDREVSPLSKRIRGGNIKVNFHVYEDIGNIVYTRPWIMPIVLNRLVTREPIHSTRLLNNGDVCQVADVDGSGINSEKDSEDGSCREDKHCGGSPGKDLGFNHGFNATNDCLLEIEGADTKVMELSTDCCKMEVEAQNSSLPISAAVLDIPPEIETRNIVELITWDKQSIVTQAERKDRSLIIEPSVAKQSSKPSAKKKIIFGDADASSRTALPLTFNSNKVVNPPREKDLRRKDNVKINMLQKLKQKRDDTQIKGQKDSASIALKDEVQPKDLPLFESYIVEEEEGSGGYGTVYRARRKSDGTTVAIKCPHDKAHRHHVSNELRMLERFGGKNFVIKFEGCLKSGNTACFVLEHVKHDRPEVLKKEIDVFELRWYGYCMFRALASLHKEGIVHRDVKPGNFLFSRKANKGYLIDFNLAMDLHQNYRRPNQVKAGNDASPNHVTLTSSKGVPPARSRRFPFAKELDAINQERGKGSKSSLTSKNNVERKDFNHLKAHNDLSHRNIIRSQGADGSGVTSVKDVTSTRTTSAERLREPLPSQGRKELLSLLQETMQGSSNKATSFPVSMRKRIAAPPGKEDGRRVYLSPMPLHSTGIGVANTGFIIKRGNEKNKKEGPCVGTKGFRAPEVLFRSLHQGSKVDIWSAGVTLLYLMTGRTPFYGDPEQNIKDISKLRGSEELWEVAKLHDRESSFPAELYNAQSLPSMTLLEWCRKNTKRQDFLEVIPSSLIDLVDRCLSVNPRLRISAEDALKHEFFAPCHESLRRQRLLRQGHSLDSGASLPSDGQNIISNAAMISH